MTSSAVARFAPVLAIGIACLSAAYFSARTGWSDYLSNEDSASARTRATSLTPGNATAWLRLARIAQANGLDSAADFSAAAKLNPLDANAWIGLGLEEELAGDYKNAEQHLLRAAEVSHEYVPRWTLLNFYFRRGDEAHFWPYAKESLRIGRGDVMPIFKMCLEMSHGADPAAHGIVPDRPEIERQYVQFIDANGTSAMARPFAAKLLEHAELPDQLTLYGYCQRLILDDRFGEAQAVWNKLIERHLMESTPLPSADGIVDASFSRQPDGVGFNWVLPAVPGVNSGGSGGGMRIDLTGKQPGYCELLYQYLPLEPGRNYSLHYEYRTIDLRAPSGLTWRMFTPDNHLFTGELGSLASEEMTSQAATFRVPPGIHGGRLVLTYYQAPGAAAAEGALILKQVTLRPGPM